MPRPRLKPNTDQRRLVKSMAAMGIPHSDIARKIGVRSPKTLRKHFREELDLGIVEANYKVAQTLFQFATGEEPDEAAVRRPKRIRGILRERDRLPLERIHRPQPQLLLAAHRSRHDQIAAVRRNGKRMESLGHALGRGDGCPEGLFQWGNVAEVQERQRRKPDGGHSRRNPARRAEL